MKEGSIIDRKVFPKATRFVKVLYGDSPIVFASKMSKVVRITSGGIKL